MAGIAAAWIVGLVITTLVGHFVLVMFLDWLRGRSGLEKKTLRGVPACDPPFPLDAAAIAMSGKPKDATYRRFAIAPECAIAAFAWRRRSCCEAFAASATSIRDSKVARTASMSTLPFFRATRSFSRSFRTFSAKLCAMGLSETRMSSQTKRKPRSERTSTGVAVDDVEAPRRTGRREPLQLRSRLHIGIKTPHQTEVPPS